jgi:hypothetical protein
VRRLTGGEGKVGKKVQKLMADLGVAGIVEGKLGDGGSTRNRTAVRSEIAGAAFWAARAEEEEEWVRKGQ